MSILKVAALVLVSSTLHHTIAVEPGNEGDKSKVLRVSPSVYVTPKQETTAAYLAKIEATRDEIPRFNARDFNDSAGQIREALTVLQSWAELVDLGARLALPPEKEAARQAFRRIVARKQAEILPILRDSYGPAIRKQLWQVDGNARTFGAGFRTIEITNRALATKANIRAAHDTLRRILLMLRFTRAEYRWSEDRNGHSSAHLKPPGDDLVVIWSENGSWRPAN